MFCVLPLSSYLTSYLAKNGLAKKFEKQIKLLQENPRHPSLKVERLEPKARGIYSFRVDKQYRALFVFLPEEGGIKIIDVNNHYK